MNPVGVIVTAALFAIGVLTLVFARQAAAANRKVLESASTNSSLKAAERSTPAQMGIAGGGALVMSLTGFLYGILPHLLE
ncbi:MAG: hypothetical protein RJQ01_05880 [Microcella sp.]|uniref:hypothetical protein n=1 Tax=Microcella sp. TaxID=1913979 RepID=UPI003314F33F